MIKKTRRRIDIYRIVKTSQNGFVDTVLSLEYAAHLPRISDLFSVTSVVEFFGRESAGP